MLRWNILCLAHLSHCFHSKRAVKQFDCFNLQYFHEEAHNKCFGKNSETKRDKIVRLKHLIRVEGRYDCCLPTSCRMADWGHLWCSQEKEKNCFSKERTMLIIWCCANSWPWISLGWKFWKKFQTIRSVFWNNLPIAGAEEKLQLFSRWRYGHVQKKKKSSKRCWLVCFPVPNFLSYACCPWSLLQFCYLSLNFQ